MPKVKISKPIVSEVLFRELANREGEGSGMSVYTKITKAESRKDGSRIIEADYPEVRELYQEADYWSGNFDEYMMPRGEWLAYRALKKQCARLISEMV